MIKHTINALILIGVSLFSTVVAAHNKVAVIPLGGSEATAVTTTITKNYAPGQYNSAFNDTNYFRNTGQEVRFNNNSQEQSLGLNVPLDLPQGAVLKSLTCYVNDLDGSINFGFSSSASIERRAKTATSSELVLSADLDLTTSGSTAGMQTRTTTNFLYTNINNTQYFYTMYVFFQVSTNGGGFISPPFTANIRFRGCEINYDIDVVTVTP